MHQQLDTACVRIAALERELASCKSSLGAMRMSRDALKERIHSVEEEGAQQLRSTEKSAAQLRQKLRQCEKMLQDMAAQAGEGQVDAASLREQCARQQEQFPRVGHCTRRADDTARNSHVVLHCRTRCGLCNHPRQDHQSSKK